MMHQRRFTKEFEVEAVRQVQTAGEASVRSAHMGRTTARGARPPPREAPATSAYRSDDGHRAETADTALRIRLQSLLCAWSSLFGGRRDTAGVVFGGQAAPIFVAPLAQPRTIWP